MIKNYHPKVVVIGMGYVGFPLACAIAKSQKYEVYGFDIDMKRVDLINKKISPIEDKQAAEDLKEISLHATNDEGILADSEIIVICVPTPVDHYKKPDLLPVKMASQSIGKHIRAGQMIILESTVNPGVCEEVVLPILEKNGLKGGKDFNLVHCPERINPGDERWNVYNIPRNVGAVTKEGTKRAADFYRSFIHAEVTEVSSLKAAEATKIVENTFRDINIAYVNELAQLFDKMGIDIVEVLRGAENKPFAFMPHYPGCGVGGHCIPVDPYYLIEKAMEIGFDNRLIRVAREVNNTMPAYTVRKLISALALKGIQIRGTFVGLLGLSYKAQVGDMRESPALEIQKELVRNGAKVLSYDPYCNGHSTSTMDTILSTCEGVIVATGHSQFISIDNWKNVKVVVDGRNCLNKEMILSQNVQYLGIGRGS